MESVLGPVCLLQPVNILPFNRSIPLEPSVGSHHWEEVPKGSPYKPYKDVKLKCVSPKYCLFASDHFSEKSGRMAWSGKKLVLHSVVARRLLDDHVVESHISA